MVMTVFGLPSFCAVCQSVIFCYIQRYKHHYDCAQPKRNQWNTTCKWPQITTPTHRGRLNDTLDTVVCGAIIGVCLRYCMWWLPIDGRERRWLLAPLAPPIKPYNATILNYVIASGPMMWLLRLFAVAWQEHGILLRNVVKLWQCVWSPVIFFYGSNFCDISRL